MDEMMQDTLEGLDDEDLEEEADAEVDKVLYDLTDGKLGQAGAVGAELPVGDEGVAADGQANGLMLWILQAVEEPQKDVETEAEMQRMQKELQDLLAG